MPERSKLTAAVAAAQDDGAGPPRADRPATPSRRLDPMVRREGASADAAQGRTRDGTQHLVDPKSCRMWARHNRHYDLLTPASCAELIASIRAQGRQEIPAVVRRLRNDPDGYDYEVVSGARRHFAVTYLREVENREGIAFLIEERELADEEAFRFSDLENRNRQDISDYERGKEYQAALDAYYGGNMTRMAERMGVSKSLLSSYLSVARLPSEVLAAYHDPRAVAVRHGQQLNPLLGGSSRRALLDRARMIAATQGELAGEGAPILSGAEVFKLLKGRPAAKGAPSADAYGEVNGRPIVTARRKGRALTLTIDLEAKGEGIAAAVADAVAAARSTR